MPMTPTRLSLEGMPRTVSRFGRSFTSSRFRTCSAWSMLGLTSKVSPRPDARAGVTVEPYFNALPAGSWPRLRVRRRDRTGAAGGA